VMSKGLKRMSVVVTVLWLFASLYLGAQVFSDGMEHRWGDAASYDAHRMAAIWVAALYWIGGTTAWWALMYAGSWIARTQAREQTLPSKLEAPLHGSSSGKENTISNVTRSEE